MKRSSLVVLALAAIVLALPATAAELAQLEKAGTTLTWNVPGSVHSLHLVLTGPDGQRFERTFPGGSITLNVAKLAKGELADGLYSWELRENLAPRTRGVDAPSKRLTLAQSGVFTIQGGAILADTPERLPTKDQVIADDLIVQNSLCVGFDCVNGESFGFDTIRLKENNTRIKFEDTSTGSFPSNDWQLTANDSASGGQNKFSVEDITGGRVPFTVEAGASTNSVYVDSTSRVGFRTANPVLDLHVSTSNTPGLRLEQNSTGGFTAQTWDIAGNEANFFVRDVTSGSRLPFRIRPGAPTSSIDIAADGDVGIGTASPQAKVHILATGSAFTPDTNTDVLFQDDSATDAATIMSFISGASGNSQINFGDSTAEFQGRIIYNVGSDFLTLHTNGAERLRLNADGSMTSSTGATLSAGGAWTNASSRELKEDIAKLGLDEARQTLAGLAPVRFRYRADRSDEYLGFIAEDVPALVATADRHGLSAMDIVAVLTKIVQDQQEQLDALSGKLAALEEAP